MSVIDVEVVQILSDSSIEWKWKALFFLLIIIMCNVCSVEVVLRAFTHVKPC